MTRPVSAVTRRQFACLAALCGLPAPLVAGEVDSSLGNPMDGCDDQPPAAATAVPTPSREDLLLQALLDLYPSPHLTPERIAGIRSGLRRQVQQSAELWRVDLQNSDGPATIFRAW